MTNREPCSRWANESSNVGPPRVGSQRQRARAGASASLSLSQKITPQMILLSHERQCFSCTNKRSARRRPPHPLRRTESNRDLAYLIRTLLRFSGKRGRRLSLPTSSAKASREKPGSVQSAPTVPAAACRRRIGCTPRREGSGRCPAGCGDRGNVRPRDGQEAVYRCLASGSSDRAVRL
jgi:hypothetical protein